MTAMSTRPRILIVDDDPTVRLVLAHQLRMLGYQSDAVASGPEAIRCVRARRYALVLMDYHMPGMDGIEAARAIRAMNADARVAHPLRIVAVTADYLVDLAVLVGSGMDQVLRKPVTFSDLQRTLARWVRSV